MNTPQNTDPSKDECQKTPFDQSIEIIRASQSGGRFVITPESTEAVIKADKALRQELDGSLQKLKLLASLHGSRNKSLSITHLEDAIMRLGMDLKELNPGNSPYPNSYNPNNAIVEPTADGLKL